jgi:hypothetical protein
MARLFLQICLNHPDREAIARCPECRQCFCRECVTEHGERMVCAACLRKKARAAAPKRFRWGKLVTLGRGAGGLLLAWLFFYSAGRLLLTIPDSFHEGVIGHGSWLDEE